MPERRNFRVIVAFGFGGEVRFHDKRVCKGTEFLMLSVSFATICRSTKMRVPLSLLQKVTCCTRDVS